MVINFIGINEILNYSKHYFKFISNINESYLVEFVLTLRLDELFMDVVLLSHKLVKISHIICISSHSKKHAMLIDFIIFKLNGKICTPGV